MGSSEDHRLDLILIISNSNWVRFICETLSIFNAPLFKVPQLPKMLVRTSLALMGCEFFCVESEEMP